MSGPVHGTHQVLISSYTKDFPWLKYCLASLRKFQDGFMHPVVCVDGGDYGEAKKLIPTVYPETRIVIKDGRRGQGFIRAQIAMMQGDIHCPGADFVYLVGSDCCAFRRFAPEVYWHQGKPVMLYDAFEDVGVGMWKTSTEEILGFNCANETMRRLPLVYPKQLFPALRAHVEKRHNMGFEDYLYRKGHPMSESNMLGSFALKHMPELYTWLRCRGNAEYEAYRTPESDSIIQWWSHGGLNRPAESDLEYLPGRRTKGRGPREVMEEILGPNL